MAKADPKNIKRQGFTLLEVIFAITIISVAMISVLGLFRYIVLAGRLSSDKFIASNLAQEGVELVRSVRDSNWLAGSPVAWDNRINQAGYYYMKYSDSAPTLCPGAPAVCPKLLIDSDGYYNYASGPMTKFTRTITIVPGNGSECAAGGISVPDIIGSNECITVMSSVSWEMLGSSYSTVAEDRLYNWK